MARIETMHAQNEGSWQVMETRTKCGMAAMRLQKSLPSSVLIFRK